MIRRRLPYCIRSDVGTLVDDVRRYRDRFREHLRIAFFSRSTEVCTSQDGIKNDPHDSTGAVKAKDGMCWLWSSSVLLCVLVVVLTIGRRQ